MGRQKSNDECVITLMYFMPEGISCSSKPYIDSDSKKWGKQYLDHSIPIISPTKAKKKEPSLIVITSYYTDNIKHQINKMKFSAKVLAIFPTVKTI